jgi:predicted  nucleic acid-binding Zn-ribbon protein
VQVGKALNDPIKGVTALGRAGVQFTAEQKELITTLTESGDVAGAQAIILGELETQFGGAAEAAANVDPYTQLANEIGNLSEDFGVIINDAIRPLVRYVREAVDAIKGWSDATKTTVLVIGGLLAALGPTLIAVGALINSYTTIKGALIAAKAAQIQMNLATLANPYVAAAAALAVLTLAMLNYKTETELAAEAKAKFDAQLEGKSLEDKYNIVQTELNKTIKQRAVVTDLLAAEQERLRKGTVALSAGAAAATAAEKPLTVEYAKQIEALDRRRDELAKQAQGIRNEIKESKRQTQATNENTTATNKNTTARETALDVFKRETAAYMAQQKAIEDLNAEMNDTLLTLRDLGEGPSVAEALLGKAPEAPFMMNLMDLEMQDELIPEEAIEGADRYVAAFMRARNAAVEFNYAVSQAVEQAAESMAYNFGEMLGTAMATGDGMQGLGRMVLGTLADLAVQVGKIAIGVGISVEGIKKALQSLNPVLAVAAGIALVALGSYARTRLSQSAGGGVPAFAQGGLVTGPTLAMVGDNRSGKEAIIPFERMGEFLQMAGAGQSNANVTVTGRLQGRDLVISNERTTFNRNRTKY